ncbi:hypothetical protein C8R43DRAFT_1137103 [Mycena crocata]|nr:hypothetical protein C8R43DRAFT_1137103 [Mycena crocata]
MASTSRRNASAGPSSGPGTANPTSGPEPQAGDKRNARERSSPEVPLKRAEVAAEYKGTMKCINVHGYILYGICSSDRPPPLPTPELLAEFNQRYEPGFLQALDTNLRKPSGQHAGAAHMVTLLRAEAEKDRARGSQIARAILEIKDIYLLTIFSALLSAGFTQWVPDLLAPPDSIYNQAHEIILIQTFKSVAGSFGYRLLEPTPSSIDNHNLVLDFYRNYAFSYMRNKAKVNLKQPGKLVQNKEEGNQSRRRKRLASKRKLHAVADKLPTRVHAIFAEPECNSDDESGVDDDEKRVLIVNAKPPRSASHTAYTQKFEAKRRRTVEGLLGKRRCNLTETPRVRIQNPPESDISFQLPKRAPIDWFAPDTYNDLPAKVRYDISKNGVALPLLEYHDNSDWKTMNKATFMAKYGNDVLALYNIPTEDEMAETGNDGWDSEGEVPEPMNEAEG